jgi:hypothetical protein
LWNKGRSVVGSEAPNDEAIRLWPWRAEEKARISKVKARRDERRLDCIRVKRAVKDEDRKLVGRFCPVDNRNCKVGDSISVKVAGRNIRVVARNGLPNASRASLRLTNVL